MNELEALNRKIITLLALIESKDAIISKCKTKLNNALELSDEKMRKELVVINKEIKKYMELDFDFDLMKIHFEKINSFFYHELNKINPTLTYKDLRLAAYIKMNLTNKEIAFLFNISHDGIKKAVQRLRKKLNMKQKDSLRTLIQSI